MSPHSTWKHGAMIAVAAAVSGCGENSDPPTRDKPAAAPLEAAASVQAPAGEPRRTPTQPPPLDLSRDLLQALTEVDTPDLSDPEAILPDLFEAAPEEKKTKLSGKILLHEEADDPNVKVDGLQIEIEVPTR